MTSVQPQAPSRLIDPVVLARIGDLELVARTVVEGVINGLHRSPHLGSSMDFAEHRAYMPGDDIRRIDWKLFGRSDRHFIKEFEADTNTNFTVLVDVSPSMHYGAPVNGGRGVSKLDYARFLAASLSYLASTQRDRVGLVTFDGEIRDYVPPSAKHLNVVLHTLDRLRPTGGASRSTVAASAPTAPHAPQPAMSLAAITRRLAESFRRRSIVLLISDLYENPRDVLDAMTFLRGKGNDLVVFHVLDRRELEFPFTDAASFLDLETGERMPVIPDYLRKQYRELVAEHVASLGKLLGETRIDYALFDTAMPLDHALFSYLAARERLARGR